MNDRALRNITVGKGGPANGLVREDRFDITAASEVMAILVLASDYADLRKRLGQIVVGTSTDGNPVKAEDIGAAGAMALLLRQAFLPTLHRRLKEILPSFMADPLPTSLTEIRASSPTVWPWLQPTSCQRRALARTWALRNSCTSKPQPRVKHPIAWS